MERPDLSAPELTAAIVQDADERPRPDARLDGRRGAPAHARERARRGSGAARAQEYWHKGATSGNTMAIVEIRDDCDGDAILLRVRPGRPGLSHRRRVVLRAVALARRRGARSDAAGGLVRRLAARQGRRRGGPEGGGGGCRGALAAVGDTDERLVEELADLWFHSYVLLAARGLDPERVEEELLRRHGAMK